MRDSITEEDEPQGITMQGLLAKRPATGRVSSGMVAELHDRLVNRVTNIFMTLEEIASLEGVSGARPDRTKPAAEFRGRWLKGLWHKYHLHYNIQAMQRNIENQWRKNPEPFFVPPYLTPEQLWLEAGKISHRIVLQGYKDRSDAGELTGEWIVYARQDGIKYYLTLGSHTEGDEAIWRRCPGLRLGVSGAVDPPGGAIVEPCPITSTRDSARIGGRATTGPNVRAGGRRSCGLTAGCGST